MELTYGHLIEKTGKKIKQELQKEINRLGFDITVDQWVLLLELYEHGLMPQVELANRTFKDAPTITRILEILYYKQLISKDASDNDRRKFMVDLTTKGKQLVDEMLPHIEVFRKQGWKGLSMDDWEHLQRIMHAIFVNFSND